MTELLAFGLVTFTTFLPMIDPFGNMSIFAAMTEGMPQAAARRVAVKSSIIAFAAVLVFAVGGDHLFELFGISVNGLKVVGGVIFMIMGYDMLQARLARTKVASPPTPEDERKLDDIAVTPLGIPLLCGPGAMTNAMLQMSRAQGWVQTLGFILGTVAIMAFTLACLLGSTRIARLLGPSGSKVILRIMGLLLMVIAVESFFSGLTPIVREILLLEAPVTAG